MGPQGPQGPAGASGTALSYADFYALMPEDNPAPILPGEDVAFPRNGVIANTDIGRTDGSSFLLSAAGTYLILFQASVTEAGQLVLTLNGEELAYTLTGRSAGTSPVAGATLITTTAANAVLTLRNPAENATSITLTPYAGGNLPASAHLVILRLA